MQTEEKTMIDKTFESQRLLFKPFSCLSHKEKGVVIKSWSNPFNAKYNSMNNVKKSVKDLCLRTEPTFTDLNNYYDCMCFRVAFDKITNKIVGTCRFGVYYKLKSIDCWDFGFNVLLDYWYMGFGTEIIQAIISIAHKQGIKTIVGSADIENLGSYKSMIKNGFEYGGRDVDGDYSYRLELNQRVKTQKEVENNWQTHLQMTRKDLGKQRFGEIEANNKTIFDMVSRIQNGEKPKKLIVSYYKLLK